MAFTPRLSLPPIDQTPAWYRTGNWFYDNHYSPPWLYGNCTWYAYGRYAEVREAFANLSLGNAWRWFGEATAAGFHTAAWNDANPPQPQLGAILCFRNSNGDDENHPGHLTVVEQINGDGTIVISNSGYSSSSSTYFWTATVAESNQYRESWYLSNNRAYVCQGFIYQDEPPTPPEPPDPPTPTTVKKMPLWMMLRHPF